MGLFPDSTPHYVTVAGTNTVQQPEATDTGLFGGCGFLGLFPKAPRYVGVSQPVGCGSQTSLFGIAQPNYVHVQPPPPRELPETTGSSASSRHEKAPPRS